MLIHQLQQLARWTVIGHWIRRWSYAVEGVLAVGVGLELAAEVMLDLLIILLLVEAYRVFQRPFTLAFAG